MTNNKTIFVDRITSIIGEVVPQDIMVQDGDRIVAETALCCWGPMITPTVFGGHEITGPVFLKDAEPGDAVAIVIENIEILSYAMTSGTGRINAGRFENAPSVKAICPYCNIPNPETHLQGIGEDSIRCNECGNPIMPQTFDNGYTVAYDDKSDIAVTVDRELAEQFAEDTFERKLFLPSNAKQHLATILGRADFSDLIVRSFPMIGNIGCIPAGRMLASKNAGDYFHTISKTDLFSYVKKEEINDAHMDIKSVGEGCIVISPVMVQGAGIHVGDVHLTQGDGEIAGHTLGASARVTIRVHLLKGLKLDGPILIPTKSELDHRFVPFNEDEYRRVSELLKVYGKELRNRNFPVQIVGSGENMNAGLENALARAAKITGLSSGEIKNRATIGGEIGIGRTSGMVYLTVMLEEKILEKIGILDLVLNQYL